MPAEAPLSYVPMGDIQIKRALVAVYEKEGIADFARALVDEFGIEVLSTGGTARHLTEAGIPVTRVEQVTGFPEMLDGRVKTLHPKVHAAILADRDKPEHMRQLAEHGIKPIDLVVVNLYPFEDTIAKPDCSFEQAIEMIDIGGPCMLRAAAKNHKHVVVVPGGAQAKWVLQEMRERGGITADTRRRLAADVFAVTADYDGLVHGFLEGTEEYLPLLLAPQFYRRASTRYGENPAQSGAVYCVKGVRGREANLVVGREGSRRPAEPVISRNEMSFNNYTDGDAALSLVKELTRATNEPRAEARG